MTSDRQRVIDQIEGIHQFFTDWVSGQCPGDDETFQRGCLDRLSPDCMVIMPGGRGFPYDVFTRSMRGNHGSNPRFRIKIRNIQVRHQVNGAFVAVYEEWQRDARDSTPPNNGRLSTMVLADRGGRLEILHVHETWLPADVVAAGDFDF